MSFGEEVYGDLLLGAGILYRCARSEAVELFLCSVIDALAPP